MLKLKKLHILGFKSFCDRTELKFHGEGIAAIVGPNGCGKSNIGDAIAWVLGEQSARTLRGTRMEDVIFAGTRDRKPTGMAEVSLTLIDPDVYDGPDAQAAPEIEIHDEMSEADWDEAALREKAATETEEYLSEVQPGPGEAVDGLRSAVDGENQEADGLGSIVDGEHGSETRATLEGDVTDGSGICATQEGESSAAGHRPSTVVLKIRRRKFKASFRAGEVVVTRRLFRSGDSEYLLNGKLCRLRDIQDIFMGTGLGPESYAIIEQGRIGQILSSKPTDRRAIIEEAAGITKYKTRKRLAEARLEEAKQNLSRVNDIFEEVTRQMNSLKRQASKAERYARVRDEMRGKLRLVLAGKFAQLRRETEELDTTLNQLAEELRAKTQIVGELELEQAESTQRGYSIETDVRNNHERISALTREIDRAFSRQRTNEERCAELTRRAESAAAELTQTRTRLVGIEAERESYRQSLESAESELEAAQMQAASAQQEAATAATALSEVERQQEFRRAAIMEAVAASSSVRDQVTRAQEKITGLERELRRLNNEIESGRLQIDTFGDQRGQIAFEFESASGRVKSLAEDIEQTRAAITEKRTAETESKRHLDTLRAEYATALGKKGSLEAVIAEHGYSTESVRRLFQSGALNHGFAPAGVLADFLEVEDRFEHVVEDYLRDELNYIVVKSWDAADEGMRLLRTDVDGRATFLVHPSDSQARFSFVLDEAAHQAPHHAQQVRPLKQTIRVLNGFGKSLEVILPKLRDGYIVPEADVARGLALENPDAFFLSQAGECFHNVTVTGGKQRAEGPLSMKRDLREVLRQLEDLERALRDEEMRVLTLGREIKDLSSLLDRLDGEKREAEHQAMTSGHMLQQLDSEMTRVSERLSVSQLELQRLAAERAEQDGIVTARQSEIAALEERRIQLEQQIAAAQ
ncbi:MAG: chromosome segregation SMC family protein, partial [Terriglobales bacterium]